MPTHTSERWEAQCPDCGDTEHLLIYPRIAVAMTADGTEDEGEDYLFEGDATPVMCEACALRTNLGALRDAYSANQPEE